MEQVEIQSKGVSLYSNRLERVLREILGVFHILAVVCESLTRMGRSGKRQADSECEREGDRDRGYEAVY